MREREAATGTAYANQQDDEHGIDSNDAGSVAGHHGKTTVTHRIKEAPCQELQPVHRWNETQEREPRDTIGVVPPPSSHLSEEEKRVVCGRQDFQQVLVSGKGDG